MTGLPYSTELYDTVASFGVRRGAVILDVGGDGSASAPFEQNGFPVTVFSERAESLPFPDERFDLVLNAQSIQFLDRAKAVAEAYRVLRPGGILAIWWKQLMVQEGVREIRDQAFADAGAQAPVEGLAGGFKEFYAAEQFKEQTLRVVPWRTAMPLEDFVAGEMEKETTRRALGARTGEFGEALTRRLRERLGESNPTLGLAYIQYLYLARKP